MAEAKGIALVTGGSRGIGRSIVERLASDGYFVLFTYATSELAARDVVTAVEKAGGRAKSICCDIGRVADIRSLFAAVDKEPERLHLLVNNAGTLEMEPVDAVTEESFGRTVDVNMRGSVFLAQEAAGRLRAGGRMIFISSVAARQASPAYVSYAISKAGVEALVRTMAAVLGPKGITVNAIAPGLTDTGMTARMSAVTPPEIIASAIEATALKRIGRPQDIAAAVSMFAGPDSGWITGQTIDCSGGYGL